MDALMNPDWKHIIDIWLPSVTLTLSFEASKYPGVQVQTLIII